MASPDDPPRADVVLVVLVALTARRLAARREARLCRFLAKSRSSRRGRLPLLLSAHDGYLVK